MENKPWRVRWHLLGGLIFPALAIFIPIWVLNIIIGVITAIFVGWEITRFISHRVNNWMVKHLAAILKKEERFRLTGTTYQLFGSLAVFLLFDKYTAITSLLFLAIGDCMARIIGQRFGKTRLFHKSLEGSLACLGSCLIIGVAMSYFSPNLTLLVAVIGAVTATLVELLPIPIDDNFTIPILSAGVMTLTMLCLGII